MEMRRVLLVGDSLFAETLTRMLTQAGAVEVIGSAPTPQAALALLKSQRPDVVVIAGAGEDASAVFGQFLAADPDLPLIRADLNAPDVQVITSQHIGARSSDLIAAITSLPKRS